MTNANQSDGMMPVSEAEGKEDRLLKVGLYVMHLISCSLQGRKADSPPQGVTWDEVYKLASRNSVAASCWRGVKSLGDEVPGEMRKRWELAANNTLYRRLMMDEERKVILKAMEERGLSYLPLKGILQADYYPHPEMRSMCDNDILYGFVEPCGEGGYRVCQDASGSDEAAVKKATKVMTEIMTGLGYEVYSAGIGNADVYQKKPFFTFEMHRMLMEPGLAMREYYENPWQRAIRDEENPCKYSFSLEDEYVYEIAHAYRHFEIAGCGVRCIVDQRAFLQRHRETADWDYVNAQLGKLGILEFEKSLERLGSALLVGAGTASEEQRSMLAYMLGSGTYGTLENRVNRQLQSAREGSSGSAGSAKWKYVSGRVFPNEDFLKTNYPFFYRHKILRPVLPIYRIAKGLLKNRSRLSAELDILRKS